MLGMNSIDGKYVKFKVDIFYSSNVVIRFRLTGGKKIIELEKRLLQKSNKWKIISTNFEIRKIDDTATQNLFRIFHLLDEYLAGKIKS